MTEKLGKNYQYILTHIVPVFKRVIRYVGRRHVASVAGSSAFWLFLSVVPMTILVSSLLPYTGISQEDLLSALSTFLPDSFNTLLEGVVEDVYASSPGVLSFSLLLTLWSAALGFSALIRGLEEIYEQPELSGYFHRRARGMLFTVVLVAALLLSILFIGLGRTLQTLLESRFPMVHNVFLLLPRLRFGAVQVVLTLLFAAIYRWAPAVRLRYAEQLPGAVFSALGWTLFSAGFSFWINRNNSYGVYGRLATVAVVMVWLYYSMLILLWGGCLNMAILRIKRERAGSMRAS